MGCNQLTGLPDDINALERLEDLYLVSNEISFLPHTLGALSRLRRLELSANALYELPRSVANLRALESLWLSSNSLATFPQQLCALDNLTTLDLQSNRLTSVPRTVGTMPALTTLLLGGNPLVYPPAGVVAQGPPAVLEYIRSHRQSDLLSSASERSVQQVAAYRDRLTSSTAGVLEERRQQQKPPQTQTQQQPQTQQVGSRRSRRGDTPTGWLEPLDDDGETADDAGAGTEQLLGATRGRRSSGDAQRARAAAQRSSHLKDSAPEATAEPEAASSDASVATVSEERRPRSTSFFD